MAVNQISSEVFVGESSGALFEFTKTAYSRTAPKVVLKGDRRIVEWGRNNLQPYLDIEIIYNNDIKPTLIENKVNITVGKRLILYTEDSKEGKRTRQIVADPELDEWMEEWNLFEKFAEIQFDLEEHANSWVEFILTRDASKVASMKVYDACDCRLSEIKGDRPDAPSLFVADWKYRFLNETNIEEVPLLDIYNPTLGQYYKSALHIKDQHSGMPYYSLPIWHGTKEWAKTANIIPEFHHQGLRNGYMLRYHIKIPRQWLSQFGTEAEQQAKKVEISEKLDSVLSGTKNAHKTFYSWIESIGASSLEWKIEKIDTDLKDTSYLELHNHSSGVHSRGHNIHPILAGLEKPGNLSSGSEILNLLNYHVAYKTARPRALGLKAINLVKNYNWPNKRNIKIGVEDTVLTTIDKNPTGQQNAMQ